MGEVIVLTVVQVERSEDEEGQLPVGLRTGVVSGRVPIRYSLLLFDSAQNVADVNLALPEEALQTGKRLQFEMQALLLDRGRGV